MASKRIELPYIPLPCIVDTNVVITANGNGPDNNPQASGDEVDTCALALRHIMESVDLVVVLDDEGRIFEEYWGRKRTKSRKSLNLSGQPGPGNVFFKWLFDNQFNPARCERRMIHCTDETNQTFTEFPNLPELNNFDLSDRKFVAVANAGTPKRPILEYGDSKWFGWKEGLLKAGIQVVFLTDYAAKKAKEKQDREK